MGELLRPDPGFFNGDHKKQDPLSEEGHDGSTVFLKNNKGGESRIQKNDKSAGSLKHDNKQIRRTKNGIPPDHGSKRPSSAKERALKKKKDKAYRIIKRGFDIAAAGSAIALGSPMFLVIALLVKSSDGGQPIYSQERLGKDGKHIRIYKFRSMRVDAEDMKDLLSQKQKDQFFTEYKIDNDPRVTKIGRILRKTSIDELPQLFNVLDGDMTLIGPRPVVKGEMSQYGDKVDKLLSVKPGLTGYWQAYARNKATYKSGARQRMELFYVDHRSLAFDFKILLKTFISVLNQEGAQ